VTLTRSDVEYWIRQMAQKAQEKGVEVIYRDGQGFTQRSIDNAYRDVKRCLFCNKRSEGLSYGMADLDGQTAVMLGSPNRRQGRILLYGLCKDHKRLSEGDPDHWNEKLTRMLESALRERINKAARRN
jgi:hypothetical protein